MKKLISPLVGGFIGLFVGFILGLFIYNFYLNSNPTDIERGLMGIIVLFCAIVGAYLGYKVGQDNDS
jgi:high-affinity Fe2+/Pb2+ permease